MIGFYLLKATACLAPHHRGLAAPPPRTSWSVTLGAPSPHAGSPRYWRFSNSLQELSVQRSGQDSVLAVILNAAVYTWLPRLRSRRPRLGRPLTSSASRCRFAFSKRFPCKHFWADSGRHSSFLKLWKTLMNSNLSLQVS